MMVFSNVDVNKVFFVFSPVRVFGTRYIGAHPGPWDGPRAPGHHTITVCFTSGNQRRWIDVSVRHPAAGTDADRTRAARKPGEASRRAERTKHERYPGEELTAFVVELPARLGGEAREWLKQQVRQLPPDTWTHELTRAYKTVSCTVQSWMARQLRKASGLK